jgi:hypothetical protein
MLVKSITLTGRNIDRIYHRGNDMTSYTIDKTNLLARSSGAFTINVDLERLGSDQSATSPYLLIWRDREVTKYHKRGKSSASPTTGTLPVKLCSS